MASHLIGPVMIKLTGSPRALRTLPLLLSLNVRSLIGRLFFTPHDASVVLHAVTPACLRPAWWLTSRKLAPFWNLFFLNLPQVAVRWFDALTHIILSSWPASRLIAIATGWNIWPNYDCIVGLRGTSAHALSLSLSALKLHKRALSLALFLGACIHFMISSDKYEFMWNILEYFGLKNTIEV